VRALLRGDRRRADEIAVLAGAHGPLAELVSLARQAGVKVSYRTREQLTAIAGTPEHQGVVARVAAAEYVDLEDLLALPGQRGEAPFFLALDQVQTLTVDLTYDAAQKRIGIKTVEGSSSIDGAYQLTPSPGDGKKTLVTYKAKQAIPLPLPEGVLKGAIKEQFVNLMNAIRKDLTQQGKMTASVGFVLRAAA
jgi:hypothetical protein